MAKRHRLAGRRVTVGYSQEKLAEVVGVDRTQVARWEAGKTTPQPWTRPLLANALNVMDTELDQLLADTSSVPKAGEQGLAAELNRSDEGSDVNRRGVLAMGGGLAATAALAAPTRVAQALHITLSDDGCDLADAVDSFTELVDHYTHLVCRSSSKSIYDELVSVRSYASSALSRTASTSRYRSDLVVVCGWLSNLLAVATSYMGDPASAMVWCADAERHSHQARHPDLAGWALLSKATIAYYQGNAQRSATLARKGQQIAPARGGAFVKLAAQEMRAEAMLGNADQMRNAQHRATAVMTKLPDAVATTGAFSVPAAEDPPYTATSLLLVGSHDQAATVTSRLLESVYPQQAHAPGKSTSNYARTLMILALARAGSRQFDEAASTGIAALDAAEPVWPTMVLGSKLDTVLAGAQVAEAVDFRARFRHHSTSLTPQAIEETQ